jgi:hypothetical protein
MMVNDGGDSEDVAEGGKEGDNRKDVVEGGNKVVSSTVQDELEGGRVGVREVAVGMCGGGEGGSIIRDIRSAGR